MASSATTAPIKRAVVQKLRASAPIGAAIKGGIHQSVAPRKVKYPFITFSFLPSSRAYQWAPGGQIYVLVDLMAFAENPVDAENIDSLIAAEMQDASLTVDGQTLWYCRRVADLSQPPTVDGSNRRIFQVGGSYRIITDYT